MIYLSGSVRDEIELLLIEAGVGLMLTPRSGYRLERTQAYPHWGADNGCFAQPEAFDFDRYLDWLDRLTPARSTCLFATAPDVVGDAAATWERSRDVLPEIRTLGYRAALVAQDGIDPRQVDWNAFDVLFVGGTDDWRFSDAMQAVVSEARRRGKWLHLGRVNSRRRLRMSVVAGFHSSDGTQLAFAPKRRAEQLVRWLAEVQGQPALPLWEAA